MNRGERGGWSPTALNHPVAWGLAYVLLALACFSGHLASGDAEAYFAVAWHLLMGEPPTIPRYLEGYGVLGPGGLYYAKFGLGQSLLILPLLGATVVVAALGGRVLLGEELRAAALLVGPVMGGLGTVVFDRVQGELGLDQTARRVSCCFLVFGGLWLVYGRYLFAELSVAVFFLLVVYGRLLASRRGDWLMGFSALGTVLLRLETILVVAPVLGLRLRETRRWRPLLALPGAAPLVIGFYNYLRFSTPLRVGMGESAVETFSTPPLLGFLGQFFAPGNGLFVYAPFLLVVLLVSADRLVRGDWNPPGWTWALLAGSLLYLLLHSAWHSWMGGWSWGPRRVVPLLPLIHLLVGCNWSRFSRALRGFMIVLLPVSLLLNLGGLAGNFNHYYRGTFYRVDVLWNPWHAQVLRQNLGLLTGDDPLDWFWVRLLGPTAGTLLVLTLIGTALLLVQPWGRGGT